MPWVEALLTCIPAQHSTAEMTNPARPIPPKSWRMKVLKASLQGGRSEQSPVPHIHLEADVEAQCGHQAGPAAFCAPACRAHCPRRAHRRALLFVNRRITALTRRWIICADVAAFWSSCCLKVKRRALQQKLIQLSSLPGP